MDFVVYSAVFGGYDTLKPARYPSLCFTDGQVNDVDGWTFKSIFSGRSPKWANRHCKILAHQHLDCDYSIYHDGNIEMLEDPEEIITAYLKDTDIAVFPHPEGRDCIYQEAKEVIRQGKARPAVVTSQMQRYRSEGYPEHNGLAACYVLLRRHTKEVKEFDQRWWEEYKNGAKRDQLSFNYVCWKLGIDYTELPGNLFTGTSNIFRRTKHRRAENIITNWKTAYGKQVIAPERVYLKDMAEKIENRFGKSTTIVNIGIFRYATMYCLRAGAPHARLVGIDIKKPDVKQEKGLNAETIIGDSTTTSFNSPVHLLFIDGDHHYTGVRADLELWAPRVAENGLIIMHDYAPLPKHVAKLPFLEGVRRAANDWYSGNQNWTKLQAPGSLIAFENTA